MQILGRFRHPFQRRTVGAKVETLIAAVERQGALVSYVGNASDTKASLLLVLTGVVTAGSFFDGNLSPEEPWTPLWLIGIGAILSTLVTAALAIWSMWPNKVRTLYIDELINHAETTGGSMADFKHYELSLVKESYSARAKHQTHRGKLLRCAFVSAAIMLLLTTINVGIGLTDVAEEESDDTGKVAVRMIDE